MAQFGTQSGEEMSANLVGVTLVTTMPIVSKKLRETMNPTKASHLLLIIIEL